MFFQNTIIRKYIASLPEEQFTMAWEQYKPYFLVPAVLTPCARPRSLSMERLSIVHRLRLPSVRDGTESAICC